jgi:hypothetical protein
MFQKPFQFRKVAIVFYYRKYIDPRVIGYVPLPLTWHTSQIIINIMFNVVIIYILN